MKKEDLQNFDGKEGRKTYVSHLGKVYDVTDSRLWKNGKHVNKHLAGMDLTEALKSAPHGVEMLERFAQVGEIEMIATAKAKTDKSLKATFKKYYNIFHPHPMLVHFPIGLLLFTAIMQILFHATERLSFEIAGYYALVTSTIFLLPTIISGFVSWWVNYALTMNKIFMIKISCSVVLLCLCVIELVMRSVSPELAYGVSNLGKLYNVLLFINVPVLATIGFNGGKLSWG